MAIRLTGKDIVDLWDAIKYACDQADDIGENKSAYFNSLLCDLLSNKAQCFVRVDNERKLETVAVTRIMTDFLKGEKFLLVQCLYSWTYKDINKWEEDFSVIKDLALKEGCSFISAVTRSTRAEELVSSLGMNEITKVYSIRI